MQLPPHRRKREMKQWRIVFKGGLVNFVTAACMSFHNGVNEYHFYNQTATKGQRVIAQCPKENVLLIEELNWAD